jgi:Mannosyltransferase (PIG-V)
VDGRAARAGEAGASEGPAASPMPVGHRGWPGWAVPLGILALSRAFSIAVVFLSWTLRVPSSPFPRWSAPFSMWDGQWYVFIAGHGYHAEAVVRTAYGPGYHDFAFFPAWPLLLRVLSLGGQLPLDAVAPIAANTLFLLAGLTIWTILDRIAGRGIGLWGLALFAFSPGAFIFSVGYSEPLYLFIAAWFFIAAERRLPRPAAILAAVAQLTRVLGAALAFASLADLVRPETRRQAILVIGATILAFAGWWTWIAILTHDPMGYMLGTPSWWLNQRPTPIPVGIGSFFDRDQWTDSIALGLLVATVLGSRWLVRRNELRLALFAFACIASCALDTQTVMPRLLAIAFPAYLGFAATLRSRIWRAGALVLFAGAQAWFGAAVTVRLIVP